MRSARTDPRPASSAMIYLPRQAQFLVRPQLLTCIRPLFFRRDIPAFD
jgi:hypothetical protein